MKITTITVSAGRTFNHPTEQYSNLRSDVSQTASLEDGDDPEECLARLRADTEKKAEQHKQHLLMEIKLLDELVDAERELTYAQKKSTEAEEATARIAELREKIAALKSKPFLLA